MLIKAVKTWKFCLHLVCQMISLLSMVIIEFVQASSTMIQLVNFNTFHALS